MLLEFLNREEEAQRLNRLVDRAEGSLGVLYGRRRCGKSRLLREVLPSDRTVYYVGDDREPQLQRASLAGEISRWLEGFASVDYPDWGALLERFWRESAPGTILVLDEFPSLVGSSTELPSLLQKLLDREAGKGVHLILTGSSQRMMQGLVLDGNAPLYGRAREILKISPLAPAWIKQGLGIRDARLAIESYAVWGGVPRYWELAAEHDTREEAVEHLVLSPLGALHEESSRLLLEDLRETTQASSILNLIGQGCHRLSEIAGRLGKPATSLSRPMQRLVDLDLVQREVPYGSPRRSSKRTRYTIGDPFLRFWFRFVEPNRSLLAGRDQSAVANEVHARFSFHASEVWEQLARESTAVLDLDDRTWNVGQRFWGTGLDRKPMEIDVVAESRNGDALLLGEAKWTSNLDRPRVFAELERKAERFPLRQGRQIVLGVWSQRSARRMSKGVLVSPSQVLKVLR